MPKAFVFHRTLSGIATNCKRLLIHWCVPMQQRAQDGCSCVRNAYNGLLNVCGSNKYVAVFLFGSPIYWFIGAIVVYSPTWNETSSTRNYYRDVISSPMYTILAILSFAWLLAAFAVLRFWPNLVSISVFIYEAFGHWCIISLIILLYVSGIGSPLVTGTLTRMYFAFITLPVFLLLLSSEILRTHRSKMFGNNVSQDRMIDMPAASVNDQIPANI